MHIDYIDVVIRTRTPQSNNLIEKYINELREIVKERNLKVLVCRELKRKRTRKNYE